VAGARNRRGLSAALAVAVNLALLSLLAAPGRYRLALPPEGGLRPVDVSVVALPVPRSPKRPSATARTVPTPATATSRPPIAATASPPAQTAPPRGEAPDVAPDAQALTAALRRGPLGCADQGAAWMSEANRDACRQGLAAGAANVPHLQGMAPAKLAYYAAVAQAEADWRSGRNPGHLPYLACTPGRSPPPHVLRIGASCFITPPVGSLNQDGDVPPP